jgi:hypothetical protein
VPLDYLAQLEQQAAAALSGLQVQLARKVQLAPV